MLFELLTDAKSAVEFGGDPRFIQFGMLRRNSVPHGGDGQFM